MKINGRPATSGTLVIGSDERAELDLPFGTFALVFNPSTLPVNVQMTVNPPKITFNGTDNSLGLGTSLTIPLSGGNSAKLSFAIYAIGDGENATRVLHYTLS
ncbi:hypothetical protein O8B39_06410 [Agrobacterium rhizogenes]|nr:hypothetical protein [Rhizobium rhizogenes]